MKAVILPTKNPGLLSPLCNWTSDYLIPVVNKPVAEHLVELLLGNNIRDIIFLMNHLPHETESYFGMGERWGCNISYGLIREYEGIIPALTRVQNRLDDVFLCFHVNTITNIDISSFIDFHYAHYGDLSIARPAGQKDVQTREDTFPFIMSNETLSSLTASDQNPDLASIAYRASEQGLKVLNYSSVFSFYRIQDLNDYQNVNCAILKGKIRGINIPGKEVRKSVWVGRQSFIHPDAEIIPPLLLGANSNVRSDVSIGECSVIGNDVIIDADSDVRRSIIYDKTYVGTNTEIHDSIVRKNFIFNLPCMSKLYVNDDSILGNMDKSLFISKLTTVYNTFAAIALFLFFSPLILILYLYHLTFPSKCYLDTESRYGNYRSTDMQGESQISVIRHYYFNSNSALIRKLPDLINVIKGDIRLVGNSTLSENEVNALTEEWQKVRFEAPTGLIHLWETEKNLTISWEDKIISESFYASTRSFMGDILILLKFLIQIKDRKVKDNSEPVSV